MRAPTRASGLSSGLVEEPCRLRSADRSHLHLGEAVFGDRPTLGVDHGHLATVRAEQTTLDQVVSGTGLGSRVVGHDLLEHRVMGGDLGLREVDLVVVVVTSPGDLIADEGDEAPGLALAAAGLDHDRAADLVDGGSGADGVGVRGGHGRRGCDVRFGDGHGLSHLHGSLHRIAGLDLVYAHIHSGQALIALVGYNTANDTVGYL